MRKLLISASAVAAALLMGVSASSAGVVYSSPGLTGELESPGSTSITFNSSSANGSLNFTLNGYDTLDGVNYYEDDFTLTINSGIALQLSYDLGGGGANKIFTNPYGASVVKSGQSLDITLSSATLFNAGGNTITFAYDSPSTGGLGGAGFAGPQGLGDEGWGIGHVVASAAPEPSTWAMMLLGFVGLGFAARRTSRKSAALAA